MKFATLAATSILFTLHAAGCVAPDQSDESATTQSVLANCASLPAISGAINPDKELIIRDVSVVDDPCRTTWTATGCGTTLGKWTFGQLMATMSGNSDPNSSVAKNFVNQWLRFWLSPQTNVNPARPQTVAARPVIGPVMLFRWLQASPGCMSPAQTVTDPAQWLSALQACTNLNLQAAPFRLLAISNRIDLDGRDYNGNNGAPGELRLAFGIYNTASPSLPSGNAEFILEYQYPNSFPPSWWMAMFHNLSSMAFGSSYLSQLQSVMDLVVGPNATSGKPNNSSIGQIRTLENSFDSTAARQWEFRQFALPASCVTGCLLAQIPVSQTPLTTDNNTAALTTWMTSNQVAISTSHHVVPNTMLAGSSLSPQLPNSTIWNTTPDINTGHTLVKPSDPTFSYNVRHNFALSTCNGCHYLETNNSSTLLFHINPRTPGSPSALSPFLTRTVTPDPNNGGFPQDYLQVPDPNPDSFDILNGNPYYFQYNEIWRRACEIRRINVGIPTPFTTPTGHN